MPVYNDKHLSYSFEKASAMVDASQRLQFPMLAGSSLPVTWRLPDLELPARLPHRRRADGRRRRFRSRWTSTPSKRMQCMVERRGRGETGVKAVQIIEGDAVWKAGEEGRWSKNLLTSALSRSDTPLGVGDTESRPQDLVASGELPKIVKNPAAYFIEYRDGLKTTLLMLDGALKDFNFAARIKGLKRIQSNQFLLTPEPNVTYSACLVHGIENMFASGNAPYPVERTLLVSGILESCLTSRIRTISGWRRRTSQPPTSLLASHNSAGLEAPREGSAGQDWGSPGLHDGRA